MTRARITVLAENTAGGQGLLGEHGLSLWIETGGSRLLFDTGQGLVLGPNARRLDLPLQKTEAIIFSHGHYDHTGGAGLALGISDHPTVYAHPDAFLPRYSRRTTGEAHQVGMPPTLDEVIRERGELVPVTGPLQVADGIMLTGPIPRHTAFEDRGGDFFLDRDCTRPDQLLDDQALYIEGAEGTLVLLGCAHAGLINTLRRIRDLTGGRPLHTVMGGMHLHRASAARMDQTVAALAGLGAPRLLPCHCTGAAAQARLWQEFPGRCAPCPTGTVLEFD